MARGASVPAIVLIGPPGSGKFTIGRRLSRVLNTRLVDTDEMIKQRMDRTRGEIFSELGELEPYRVKEQVVARALTHDGIALLGNGAVTSQAICDLLTGHNVVYLEISISEGVRRTAGNNSRLIFRMDDPEAHYRTFYEAHRTFYKNTTTFEVRSDERFPQRAVAEIPSCLNKTCDGA